MMKNIFLAALLSLFSFAAMAGVNDNVVTAYNFNGYNASVEDTGGSLRVSVRPTESYGQKLQYTKNSKGYENGQRVKYIEVAFDGASQLNLQQPIGVSDSYNTSFSKGTVIQKVLLTIKQGNTVIVSKHPIWVRNPAQ